MNDTIDFYLERIRDSLPESLIDETGYKRVSAIAGQLPKYLSTFWGFEVKLGSEEPLADILFSIINESEGQRLLAERSFSPATPDDGRSAWGKLHNFAGLWSEQGHPFHDHVKNVWLEFDASDADSYPDPSRVIEHPNLFFGPDNDILDRTRLVDLMSGALNVLAHDVNRANETRTFIESLPSGANLFQVGLMLPRPTDALRICVKGIKPDMISPWLREIKWHGDHDALNRMIDTIARVTNDMAVDIDLAPDGPADKIGIECYMDWMADDAAQWKQFLDAIEHLNLCLPRKRNGLLAYPGTTAIERNGSGFANGILCLEILRKINHVKLNFMKDGAIEAKAYLAVIHPTANFNKTNGWMV